VLLWQPDAAAESTPRRWHPTAEQVVFPAFWGRDQLKHQMAESVHL